MNRKKSIFLAVLSAAFLAGCAGTSSSEASTQSSESTSQQGSSSVEISSEGPASSVGESSQEATTAAYKVEYELEDATGAYVKDESKTENKTGTIGEEITVTPAEIPGYTLITDEEDLSGTVNKDGTLVIVLQYRKNYTMTIKEPRVNTYFNEGDTPTIAGETVVITRTGEDPIEIELDENNLVSAQITTEGDAIEFVVSYGDKNYEGSVTLYVLPTAVKNELDALVETYTVDVYRPITDLYTQKGTYEFDYEVEEVSLLAMDELKDAYAALYPVVATRGQSQEDRAAILEQFEGIVLEAYQDVVVASITEFLKGGYSILNNEIFGASNGHLDVGMPGGYITWVATDPTDIGWGNADNRWWIPDCYKANWIINYATNNIPLIDTMADVKTAYEGLLRDGFISVTSVLAEAEMKVAVTNNTHLTVNGDGNANEWWYVWAYCGNSGFEYSGVSNYNAASCTDYRLQKVAKPGDDAYADTLEKAKLNGNWLLVYQVDDSYAPQAAYTIKHAFDDGTGTYVVNEELTENKSGRIGLTVTATAKTVEGYTVNADSVLTGTIAEDGSLVITINYDKDSIDTTNLDALAAKYTVNQYTTYPNLFDTQATYEYNVAASNVEICKLDGVKDAYAQLYLDVAETPANEESLIEAFEAVALAKYKEICIANIEKVAVDGYNVFTKGIFANDGVAVNCGATDSYQWVMKNPLDYSWDSVNQVTTDNRWWIPEMYKTNNIIKYSKDAFTSLTTIADVSALYEGLICDVLRGVYQAIIEALVYKYSVNNWGWGWGYYGAAGAGFTYVGHTGFTGTYANDFRLTSFLYNPSNEAFATTPSGICVGANWAIAHQIIPQQ